MRQTEFRFNPKTLRYEPVGFSFWRFGLTLFTYLTFGFLFFIGLNLLQNFLIETKLEKELIAENNALIEYKAVLTAQIAESNSSLDKLKTEEAHLNEKLFEVPEEETTLQRNDDLASFQLETANDLFDKRILFIEERLNTLNTKAKKYRQIFTNKLTVKKADVTRLANLPSIAPVKELMTENLVSGFGIRINPFHKGNYHHDGIDIALTKGTEVLAAGNGKVASYGLSNLEGGYGNYIEIDHGNGIISRYSHLEKISVTWGQKISQGQVIALSGSSGGSVAPHLHFEVINNGESQDPLIYMVEGINPAQHLQLVVKSKIKNQSLD